jgi:isoleucyl-tRNA synthetase
MVDYREDMRFSQEMLPRLSEAYRKVRNTCRYLLSNLFDFDPARHAVAEAELEDVDRYALARHRQVVARVLEAYRDFEFHVIYHQVVQYCAVDLSSFYLDVLKDRLYCDAADGPRRRSAQTVLHRMALDLAALMAPVLPFTSDEVWAVIPGKPPGSVHLAIFPEPKDPGPLGDWPALLEVRSVVMKALEEERAAKRVAGSLEAHVVVRAPKEILEKLRRHEEGSTVFPGNLANLFIVSKVTLAESDAPVTVEVLRAAGARCERCWTYSENVGRLGIHSGVCERCAAVLAGDALGER